MATRSTTLTSALSMAASMAALAVLAWPGGAVAQERVTSVHVPDIDMVEPVIPHTLRGAHYDAGPRLMVEVGASAGARMSAGPGATEQPGVPAVPSLGHMRLRYGKRWARTRAVRWRSELTVEDAGPDSLTGMLTGRHDMHVQYGLGSERRNSVGADMVARARFHHLGDARRVLDAVDVGVGAHTRAELDVATVVRVAGRSRSMDASGFAFPMSAVMRRMDYLGRDAAVSRATTSGAAVGVGARMIDRHVINLLIEILGVSHVSTELDSNPAVPWDGAALVPGDVSQTTVRLGGLDLALYDDGLVVVATGYTGWTWLRGDDGARRANLLEMQYGFKIRGMGKGMGLGFGRTGHATADGGRFVAEYRFEVHAEYQDERQGGLLRASTGWLADKERDGADDPGMLGRHALYAEHYLRLPVGVSMGLYGLATSEPAMRGAMMQGVRSWDPWQRERGSTVELGGFMRWTADYWKQP